MLVVIYCQFALNEVLLSEEYLSLYPCPLFCVGGGGCLKGHSYWLC
jgi:hypothetical protein